MIPLILGNGSIVIIFLYKFYRYFYRNIDLNYEAYNEHTVKDGSISPPPILICHGLFGNRKNWNSLSKKLNQLTGRTVILTFKVQFLIVFFYRGKNLLTVSEYFLSQFTFACRKRGGGLHFLASRYFEEKR